MRPRPLICSVIHLPMMFSYPKHFSHPNKPWFQCAQTTDYVSYLLDICRPTARVENGSSRLVQSSAHGWVANRILLQCRIATVHLQAIHTPLCKRLSILLNVVLRSRVTSARLCPDICMYAGRIQTTSPSYITYTYM